MDSVLHIKELAKIIRVVEMTIIIWEKGWTKPLSEN